MVSRGRGAGSRPAQGPVHEQGRGQPAGRGFQVALDAAQLSADPEPRDALDGQGRVQHRGRLHVGVAVDAAEAREHGVLQARDEAEDLLLGAPLQAGLEAHQVEVVARQGVLAQLHRRRGASARCGDHPGPRASWGRGAGSPGPGPPSPRWAGRPRR